MSSSSGSARAAKRLWSGLLEEPLDEEGDVPHPGEKSWQTEEPVRHAGVAGTGLGLVGAVLGVL